MTSFMNNFYSNITETFNSENIYKYKNIIIAIVAVVILFIIVKYNKKVNVIPILDNTYIKILIAILLCGIITMNDMKYSAIIYITVFLLFTVLNKYNIDTGKEGFEDSGTNSIENGVPQFDLDGECNTCLHKRQGCTHQLDNECADVNYDKTVKPLDTEMAFAPYGDAELLDAEVPEYDESSEYDMSNGNSDITMMAMMQDKTIPKAARDFTEYQTKKDDTSLEEYQMFDRNYGTICPKSNLMPIA